MPRLQPILILLLTGLTACSRYQPDNPRLTTEKILAVRPGMTSDQVIALLGEPLARTNTGTVITHCNCNAVAQCVDSFPFTFEYTTPRASYPYPMLWVHFNSNARVKEVYAKRYHLLDDEGIYSVSRNPCDTTDSILPLNPAIANERYHGLGEFF